MPTLALSTGEAELGALIRGAAEGEGIISILSDYGLQARLMLQSDAAAAIGITQRLGLGRVRHLSVSDLWIQQQVREGALEVSKIPGEKNGSDLLTKPVGKKRIDDLLPEIGVRCEADSEANDFDDDEE